MLLVFLYTVARAWTVSISHDEALTYLHHARGSWLEILLFSGPFASNNHLLNTILIKGLVRLVGLSELAMRVPALFGHALYLVGMYKIAPRVGAPRMLPGILCLVALHPFMLDLFSCARGYALGLGFMSLGLYYFLVRVQNPTAAPNATPTTLACWFLTLAVLANLSFLHLYLAMAGFFLILECVRWRSVPFVTSLKTLGPSVLASGLCLLAIYTVPVRTLIERGELYYGGENGFWGSTVASLIDVCLYGRFGSVMALLPILEALIIVVWIAACLFLARQWIQHRAFDATERALFSLMLLTTLCVFAMEAQWLLLGTKFVIGRTAVYFVPLFFLFLATLWALGRSSPRRPIARGFGIAATVLIVVVVAHAVRNVNLSYFHEWRYDASTKLAMQAIRNRHAGQDLEVDEKTIGVHWIFEPSVNFYRAYYDLAFLRKADRGGPFDEFDYYYLFDRDDPDLKDRRVRMDLTRKLRPHLETIREYELSNTVLAVPRNSSGRISPRRQPVR